MSRISLHHITALTIVLSTVGCSSKVSLDHLLTGKSPYEKYVSSIKQASLEETLLGKNWLLAGEQSLTDSLHVNLPHAERGYFTSETPAAVAFRYAVQRGQAITIDLAVKNADSVKFFLDVFGVDGTELSSIVSTDTLRTLSYEVEETGVHLFRLQPELLASSGYDLSIRSEATLGFPVSEKNQRAVGSFFGDPRDGGKRSHRGIDIFAPKGTPVVAAYEGVVTPKTQSGLGGKVVWLSSFNKKFNQYYAHLDSQAVKPGQRVSQGDTLGFVGNTGNARFTPPHLHFSIYSFGRGAVDPYPYVVTHSSEEVTFEADSSLIGREARVQSELANIRQAPSTQSSVLQTVAQHTPVFVVSATGSWYRIRLPDGTRGFAHQSLIQSISDPITTLSVTEAHQPYLTLYPTRLVPQLWVGQDVKVIGSFQSVWYVETEEGERLWMQEAV